jgi:hypothetical protein
MDRRCGPLRQARRVNHGVSSKDFDTAWHDPERKDMAEQRHEERGPYYVSIGQSISLGWPVLALVMNTMRRASSGQYQILPAPNRFSSLAPA